MSVSSSEFTLKSFNSIFKPTLAWAAIGAVTGLVAIGLIAKLGGILRLVFPVGCFFSGLWLYFRYPILYLGFTWWIWFLTPFVRRLADLQSGWLDPNPIMLAPFLTTLITAITFVRCFPKMYRQGGFPFLLAVVAVIYGLVVGMMNWSIVKPIVPFLNWLTPILFGFHLFANWQHYPRYRQILQRVFLWGVVVMGTYGIIQYLIAPAWDRVWLTNQDTLVFGFPEPLGIRVFSTMNSTQPFACVMAAGLVLLFSSHSKVRFLAAGTGCLSFLLTLARSSWFGWIVSMIVFVPSLKQRAQFRIVLTIIMITLMVLPLATVDPFASVIQSRFQSLFNISDDISFNARSVGYSQAFGLAFSEFIGQGLGGAIISDSLGANDSGILSLIFILGWIGTILYSSGLIVLLASLTRRIQGKTDMFAAASRAIAYGTFAQIWLNESMLGVFGMVLWGFLGISLAAQRYYHQHQMEQPLDEVLAVNTELR